MSPPLCHMLSHCIPTLLASHLCCRLPPGLQIHWMRAARTDKGVSAVGQVVSLKMVLEPEGMLQRINAALPDQVCVCVCAGREGLWVQRWPGGGHCKLLPCLLQCSGDLRACLPAACQLLLSHAHYLIAVARLRRSACLAITAAPTASTLARTATSGGTSTACQSGPLTRARAAVARSGRPTRRQRRRHRHRQ